MIEIRINCEEHIKNLYLDLYREITNSIPHKNYSVTNDMIDLSSDEDAGFDLIIPDDNIILSNSACKIDHKIKLEVFDLSEQESVHYFIAARSSIVNTPLIFHNSIGVIDKGYRGYVFGPVYNVSNEPYSVKSGSRLFQIILPNLGKISQVRFVESLSTSKRGNNGFGSTSKVYG